MNDDSKLSMKCKCGITLNSTVLKFKKGVKCPICEQITKLKKEDKKV
jgi:hypothetical protein